MNKHIKINGVFRKENNQEITEQEQLDLLDAIVEVCESKGYNFGGGTTLSEEKLTPILKISFDFDQTLSELPMQELAKKYLQLGAEVYITTSRTEHLDGLQYDNSDVFEVAEKLGIKRENITFTNYDDKYKFVKEYDVHFDDDEQEVALINEFPTKCIGFLYQQNFNNVNPSF